MLIVAVTGGLGSGKSTAAEHFRSLGATVLSLDDIAHDIIRPGTAAFRAIVEEFGSDVVRDDGSLDRAALAAKAFSSPEKAHRLNSIVHPVVAGEVGPALRELDALPMKPEVVVLDVPLLVEAPVFRELADQVLAIEAPVEVRVNRALARGMSEDDARARIACQATDAERAELADDVIVNDGTLAEFSAALQRYWDDRVAMGGVRHS